MTPKEVKGRVAGKYKVASHKEMRLSAASSQYIPVLRELVFMAVSSKLETLSVFSLCIKELVPLYKAKPCITPHQTLGLHKPLRRQCSDDTTPQYSHLN
jgi:hypothetical protein